MFGRSLFLFALVAVLASQVPALLGLTEIPAPSDEPVQQVSAATTSPRTAALAVNGGGHYSAVFRINGKPVEGMVDTGASLVALNESTARRLGYSGNRLEFKHQVSTANGRTEAAHVVLDRIELQGVRVRQVDAFVLRDAALASTLVGMSFLSKLSSFRVDDGVMKLTQ
ncbi:TIGR02281 family clan AA aspartic protease [Pseudorhizobium endolithicum]|uniref:TIGR02281 family clan AA aspartic protease n=1 Tax=Pseudorhizobium endolithicum TaxID=1191678 RepID=A0ABN7JL07_9HYPH|nr:TIGR02281 family clan AA aspartic protease [Pseudorhizobium endolithicum]CAD7029514.1 TIGR02281 family clan AA aspartic protease [Pseudorhizobium endolithicum]